MQPEIPVSVSGEAVPDAAGDSRTMQQRRPPGIALLERSAPTHRQLRDAVSRAAAAGAGGTAGTGWIPEDRRERSATRPTREVSRRLADNAGARDRERSPAKGKSRKGKRKGKDGGRQQDSQRGREQRRGDRNAKGKSNGNGRR